MVVRFRRNLTRPNFAQAIAHDAFRALVNLSDSPIMISALSDTNFLQFLVSYILVGGSFLGSGELFLERLITLSPESASDTG